MLASNLTGTDTITPADAYGYGDFAEAPAVRNVGPPPMLPPQTEITGMETMLQCLLPGTPVLAPWSRPGPARRDWTTIVCFSCGKPGHGIGMCPEMDETFPHMLPGWSAEKVGANFMMISPRVVAARRRAGNGD